MEPRLSDPAAAPASAEAPIDWSAKWPSLLMLSAVEVLALSTWFSTTAVIPALRESMVLSDLFVSFISSAVSLGFVAGTLLSAFTALPDRVDPRRLIFFAAILAATANGAILLVGPDTWGAIGLRFLTGVAVAALYPVGVKVAATWARPGAGGDLGAIIGLLLGALVLGTAVPYLFTGLSSIDWRWIMGGASVLTLLGGICILPVKLGPGYAQLGPGQKGSAFRPEYVMRAWRDPATRYANLGYFGHMVELYVAWAWIGLFLFASFEANPETAPDANSLAGMGAFTMIGMGAVGCILGGLAADRIGRTAFTIIVMAISGLCTLLVGQLFGGAPIWLFIVCVVWGTTIVADSGQFSSCVMELSTPETRGTVVTFQVSIGFFITVVMINVMPLFRDTLGWEWAFAPYALGPAVGIWFMWKLRREPDAVKLAGGRR